LARQAALSLNPDRASDLPLTAPVDSSQRGTSSSDGRIREHLANERTLLAWIRTAIAFIGLGFVVARFGLFLRATASGGALAGGVGSSASGPIGVTLVAAGVLTVVAGGIRFLRIRKQIDMRAYRPDVKVDVGLIVLVVLGGSALVAYLLTTGR
jgi:putative membrane protein